MTPTSVDGEQQICLGGSSIFDLDMPPADCRDADKYLSA